MAPIVASSETLPSGLPLVTRAQVAEHNNKNDVWLIIDNTVYDVTKWAKYHPGGFQVMWSFAGMDVTDSFHNTHIVTNSLRKKLSAFAVGVINEPCLDKLTLAQRELASKLQREGFYETSFPWYAFVMTRTLALLAISVWCVVANDSFAMEMVGACFLAAFFQQIAFLGHDAGHNCISHDREVDWKIGIFVGNLMSGISIGWWKATHNTHHVITNSVNYDPDIQHLPVFAVHKKMFASLYSFYHNRPMPFDAAAKLLVRYQHILFFPVMFFARFNLYVQSFLFVALHCREFKVREVASLCVFWTWMSVLLSFCQTWGSMWAFLILSHGLAGILHVQICISHFAMEMYHGVAYAPDKEDFFRRQVNTSMDIQSNFFTHWFHGGLDYQIEHHLFPRVARHHLPRIKPMVQQLCKDHGLHYHSVSFYDSIVETVVQLKNVAVASQDSKVVLKESMLWQAMNAIG